MLEIFKDQSLNFLNNFTSMFNNITATNYPTSVLRVKISVLGWRWPGLSPCLSEWLLPIPPFIACPQHISPANFWKRRVWVLGRCFKVLFFLNFKAKRIQQMRRQIYCIKIFTELMVTFVSLKKKHEWNVWSSQCAQFQLKQLKKQPEKNSGLNGNGTHHLAIPVQCYQRAIKPHG